MFVRIWIGTYFKQFICDFTEFYQMNRFTTEFFSPEESGTTFVVRISVYEVTTVTTAENNNELSWKELILRLVSHTRVYRFAKPITAM